MVLDLRAFLALRQLLPLAEGVPSSGGMLPLSSPGKKLKCAFLYIGQWPRIFAILGGIVKGAGQVAFHVRTRTVTKLGLGRGNLGLAVADIAGPGFVVHGSKLRAQMLVHEIGRASGR